MHLISHTSLGARGPADGVGAQVVAAAGHGLEEVVGAEALVAAAADVEPAVRGHDVQSRALLSWITSEFNKDQDDASTSSCGSGQV